MADPYAGLGLELDDEEERRRQLAEMSALDDGGGADLGQEPAETTIAGPPATSAVSAPASVAAPGTTGTPVPPPPPPPPPATFEGLTPQLGEFASRWLDDPNAYLSDLAQAERRASEERLGKKAEEGRVGQSEYYASRGLTGSSYEDEGRRRLESDLRREAAQDEAAILDRIASGELAGRSAAANFGLEAIRAGDVLGLERYRAGLEGGELGEAQRQFDLSIGQRESEFARSFGLDEREFTAQQEQFTKQFGEQVAGRLQQNEQFRLALESDNARYGLDIGLREKALTLQEKGMNMEDAYRRAALDQERELTKSAQALQEKGLQMEDAYRYAALEQDGTFRREAQRLQELGMTLDEAYRQAELTFRKTQSERDEAFRQAEAKREQDRFNQMIEAWMKAYGGGGGVGGGGDPRLWDLDVTRK